MFDKNGRYCLFIYTKQSVYTFLRESRCENYYHVIVHYRSVLAGGLSGSESDTARRTPESASISRRVPGLRWDGALDAISGRS